MLLLLFMCLLATAVKVMFNYTIHVLSQRIEGLLPKPNALLQETDSAQTHNSSAIAMNALDPGFL
jgi:hypothetical protein